MNNINDYIGMPHNNKELNCWNSSLMIMKEVYGIDIPVLNGVDKNSVDVGFEIENQISTNKWKKIDQPEEPCFVLMKSFGSNNWDHIGIAIDNGKSIFHSMSQSGCSVIHKLKFVKMMFKELEFYQYEG